MSEKLGAERQTHDEWRADLEALDLEIVRLAVICEIRLLEPGVIGRVLDNDARDCSNDNIHAFTSLRGLLFLHFEMQRELSEAFGQADTHHVIHRVWAHLMPRIGDQLGTPPNPGAIPSA